MAHARLQHLVRVKARILTEQPLREGCDQHARRAAKREMARNQSASLVDLSFSVEGVQQGRANVLDPVRKIVQRIALFAGKPRRRNVEVAGKVDRDSP